MICDCKKINFRTFKMLSYWENKNITSDEKYILNFLKKKNLINKKILHIGIGNSYLEKSLKNKILHIDGITISGAELDFARKLNLSFYKSFLIDKHNYDLIKKFKTNYYDIIIDNNLKSYSCCNKSFNFFFKSLYKMLKKNGYIITSQKGMKWYKKLEVKKSFNFKNFFYNKVKEVPGSKKNKLSVFDCMKLSCIYSLKITLLKDLVIFQK